MKSIYFIPPDEGELSGEESDDEEDFRIPIRKKVKLDRYEVKRGEGEHMEPFYNPRKRITMFIAGAQNCEESYFVGEFIKTCNKIHLKRPVYLFTGLSEKEKHFEDYDIRAIIMDQENIEILDLEKLRVDDQTGKRRRYLLIFDDTDRIRDK